MGAEVWAVALALITGLAAGVFGLRLTVLHYRGEARLALIQEEVREGARRHEQLIEVERASRVEDLKAAASIRHELRNDNQELRLQMAVLRTEFEQCRERFFSADSKLRTVEQEVQVLRRQLGIEGPPPPLEGIVEVE